MERIWKNYRIWEDYAAGMYATGKSRQDVVDRIVEMFNDGHEFSKALHDVFNQWPNSMEHNLSYVKSNRQSYLGQAASAFLFGATIQETTAAWGLLREDVRSRSNEIADCFIKLYDISHYGKMI